MIFHRMIWMNSNHINIFRTAGAYANKQSVIRILCLILQEKSRRCEALFTSKKPPIETEETEIDYYTEKPFEPPAPDIPIFYPGRYRSN
jgi:hypothetical protein